MRSAYLRAFQFLFIFLAAASASSLEDTSSPSPSAEAGLICHTTNPSECYPRIFRARTEFHVVHEDQHLPPGLHVRLNVETGLKEAKLYDPSEDEKDSENATVMVLPEGVSVTDNTTYQANIALENQNLIPNAAEKILPQLDDEDGPAFE